MENQKPDNQLQEYQQILIEITNQSSSSKSNMFFQPNDSQFRQKQLGSQNSFLGRVYRNIVIAKKKILENLYTNQTLYKKNQLEKIKEQLKNLRQPTRFIIRDGIISLYSQLSEIREQSNNQKQKSCFFQFLDNCLDFLQPVLKDHFIYRQIQKIDNKNSDNSLKDILSQKRIHLSSQSLTSINQIHSIKQIISERAIAQLTKQIENKPIQELINKQLKGQQDQMEQVMQRCRICNNNYRLKNLTRHIKYCKKIQQFSCKRDQIIQEQKKVIEKMKKWMQIYKKCIKQKNQIFKIYNKIISAFEDSPKMYRRNSLKYQKIRKKQIKRLSSQIDQLLNITEDEILTGYKTCFRQRQMVQRKISSLESNYLHQQQSQNSQQNSQNSQNSYEITINSLKTSKLVSMKTKKSLFASNTKKSCYSESQNKIINQIPKSISNKAHMVQIIDSSESQIQQKDRLCKSMKHFHRQHQQQQKQISLQDFQILKFLGKGAFGKVYLVRRRKTKDIYALKVIKIQQNWGQQQLKSIINEHVILSKIAGQHLVKAPFSFTEGYAHFFVLQYMPGGDLSKILQQQIYLDVRQSQFYLAQIVLAIELLHDMGIIHRDLKPENLIFDQKGHLKLTDFGLSQIRINDKIRRAKKKSTQIELMEKFKAQQNQQKKIKVKQALIENKKKGKIIGTPDYIAPQILSQESLDNLSIDWWSFGVIAYQMMIGCRPFCANTIDQVIKNIQEYNIEWPQIGQADDMINPIAADLIKKLLNPNYRQRLGNLNICQIKLHPFFEGINWQQIKQMKPPLMPSMDQKQNYQYCQQNATLKSQIIASIGSNKVKSSFKLDNFVRYDILIEQTLESADKQIVRRQDRIKKLKSIALNFGNQKQIFFDEQIEESWVNFKNK